ncbi:MAG TPA: hypothetical protein VMS45_02640 [Gemmatimonadaceae bacterium]|nr:hypothetical protein [Gemmatimonadaceae bacterium]
MSAPLLDPEPRYSVAGHGGIAFYFAGNETEPDADTHWTGYEVDTGRVVMVMVGDDRRHSIDPDDCTALGDLDYCAECGQIGCEHDGRER